MKLQNIQQKKLTKLKYCMGALLLTNSLQFHSYAHNTVKDLEEYHVTGGFILIPKINERDISKELEGDNLIGGNLKRFKPREDEVQKDLKALPQDFLIEKIMDSFLKLKNKYN
jgi:hypothetical protein